jgi:uncharacterized protein
MNRREFVIAGLCGPALLYAFREGPEMTASNLAAGREIMWRRTTDNLSFENARLLETETGPEISGSVLIAQNGVPLCVDYCIACDASWQTRTVRVEQTWRGVRRRLRLDHDGNGHWHRDGKGDTALAGCSDVDLNVSPSTNALPINRLRLPMDAIGEINAAWIRLPELEITPVRQSYRRLSERQYEYKNLGSGFTALIDVDGDGLPTDYAGVWQRAAEGTAAQESSRASFARVLISEEPSTELGDAADTFNWLVGGWAAQVREFDPDGRVRHGSGEWWFSWALEGRAMQDVWICPPRTKRIADQGKPSDPSSANNRYGTTIRWFDRKDGAWRIAWVNPVSGAMNNLSGKREGDRIVLLGKEDDSVIRWSFNEIQTNSFTWRGEQHQADGQWRLSAEFQLRRMV